MNLRNGLAVFFAFANVFCPVAGAAESVQQDLPWPFFPGKGKVAFHARVHDREAGTVFYIVYPNMNRGFTLEEAVARSPHFESLEEVERFRDQTAPDFALVAGTGRFPQSWPYADITPLSKELKEQVAERMALDEIRDVLGPEHEVFGFGVPYSVWYFDDGTCLTVCFKGFFWRPCEPGRWTFELLPR